MNQPALVALFNTAAGYPGQQHPDAVPSITPESDTCHSRDVSCEAKGGNNQRGCGLEMIRLRPKANMQHEGRSAKIAVREYEVLKYKV
jgi:hypothetical protein